MSHRDYFVGAERQRVENVLCILTAIADRLETKHELTTRLIGDAFEFVRASEQEGLDDTGTSAGEPHLRLSVHHHVAARIPVRGMQQALVALDRGDKSACDRFARYACEGTCSSNAIISGAATACFPGGTRPRSPDQETPAARHNRPARNGSTSVCSRVPPA